MLTLTFTLVALTTLTLSPDLLTSAATTTTTTTTTTTEAPTTTPVTNPPFCSMDVEEDSIIVDEGVTRSYLANSGLGYVTYTCHDADSNNMTQSAVDCANNQCISPMASQVDGNFTCVACETLYDQAEDCSDQSSDPELCQETDLCYSDPQSMMKDCCQSCKDNTPAETNPPTTTLATEGDSGEDSEEQK